MDTGMVHLIATKEHKDINTKQRKRRQTQTYVETETQRHVEKGREYAETEKHRYLGKEKDICRNRKAQIFGKRQAHCYTCIYKLICFKNPKSGPSFQLYGLILGTDRKTVIIRIKNIRNKGPKQ